MADTQRTRAALLVLLADNVAGDIGAQDVRDMMVTIMEQEFANPGDFWKQPHPELLTTDRTGRGWKEYSQAIGSTCSFGNTMQRNQSGEWVFASFNGDIANVRTLGVAMESYASGISTATILRTGIYKHSLASTQWSGDIGVPYYLLSGTAGSMTTAQQSVTVVLGYPEMEGSDFTTSFTDVFRFNPGWGIVDR